MKNLIFLAFILLGTTADSQQKNITAKISGSINEIKIGAFDNYAFVVNGTVIERNKLIDLKQAEILDIYPFNKVIEGKNYLGVVYFHTKEDQTQPGRFSEDPAWFLNGRQVSSFNIRETSPEYYTQIVKSTNDTTINNKLYKGSIHITTEENYFDIRTNLAQVLLNYHEIDPKETTLFWYRSVPPVARINDIGVIQNNLAINYLDEGDLNKMRVDSLQFAKGKKFIFQVINGGNRFRKSTLSGSSNKAITIFKNPLMIDTECTCYLSNFDRDSVDIFRSVEFMPKPYDGEVNYLKKLAATLGLSNKKANLPVSVDSINVSFLITNIGLLTELESTSGNTGENAQILHSIKKNACLWTPGIQNGNFVNTHRTMMIYYTKDRLGRIKSFDKLAYL